MHGFFDEIMADGFAVTCEMIALYHLDLARDRSRHLISAGIAVGASFLFQYAIGCLAPLLVYYTVSELWPRRASNRAFWRTLGFAALAMAAVATPFLFYKWAVYGSPFHSKVIQFPLFGFHFFGGFFYAVNYFAFFGIPAAALALHGFWRALKGDGLDRFMVFGLLSYALFWIGFYQWHDARFFLYFVPFIAYFFARSVTDLHITALFSRRTATPQQLVLAYVLLPICLLYALHKKDNAFVSNELPLTPQNVLIFPKQKVTKWGGNETIDVAGVRMNNITTHVPGLHFFGAPHGRRTGPLPGLAEALELRTVAQAARDAKGASFTVRACGALAKDYFSEMRRLLTLKRDIRPCDQKTDLALYAAADAAPPGATTLFTGKVYRLVASP